jgi:hypothetical protein
MVIENEARLQERTEELLRFLRRLAIDREIEARALRTYIDLLEHDLGESHHQVVTRMLKEVQS